VLPLYLVPSPWQRRLVAVPFRDRGGPIWDDDDGLDALVQHAMALAREHSAALVLKTLCPLPVRIRDTGLTRIDHWVHSRLDVGDLDKEMLWERIGAKRRNMVRQAEKEGLRARLATVDKDAVHRWYALHLRTQQRLGVPPFPIRFFSTMLDTLRASGCIELIETCRGGNAYAAALLLWHGKTCIYGYTGSTAEGHSIRANDLLVYSAICCAIDRGMHSFDLGSDSPAQETLLFFKRTWGAVQRAIPSYWLGTRSPLRDSSAERYRIPRAVFQHLPLPILELFGRRLTRYLG
jgi:lipid II:glycine glycyltransferase (peptidoglycan interpeptide bridge formation enzyme)